MEALSCIRFSYILLFVSYVAAQNAETKSPEGFATLEAPKSVPSPSPVPVPSPSPVPVPSPSPVPVPVPSTTPRQKADVPEKDLMQALYLTETPDRTYYVTVGIGNPPQFLRLLLHTGIGDIWVRQCHSYLRFECLTRTSYWPAHSSTASREMYWQEYVLRFHPSTYLAGHLAKDNIQLGSKTIQEQSFAVFDRVYHTSTDSTCFNNDEGFFGLGPPLGSVLMEPFFIKSMVAQRLIREKIVSIYLLKNGGGELMLGGINPAHRYLDRTWVVASNNDGGWEIVLEDIYMRNAVHTCDDSCDATISTATSHIMGPPEDIKMINDYLLSRSSKKPKKSSALCTDRVYSIMKESFHKRDNSASAEEVCMSMEWCHRGHLDKQQTFDSRKLLEQDAQNFEHNFGCAACVAIVESVKNMDRLEDYDPEFGVSLCTWLSILPSENSFQNHTEEVDCDAAPLFEFLRIRVNDKNLYLDSRDYIYKRVHPNLEITCHTEFVPHDDPEGGNWIFGTSFLRAFHTVIDYEKTSIGFAPVNRPLWVH